MLRLKMMCDKCFRMLGDNEPMMGFVLIDDEGNKRAFKGHEGCVQEIAELLNIMYGLKEEDKNE